MLHLTGNMLTANREFYRHFKPSKIVWTVCHTHFVSIPTILAIARIVPRWSNCHFIIDFFHFYLFQTQNCLLKARKHLNYSKTRANIDCHAYFFLIKATYQQSCLYISCEISCSIIKIIIFRQCKTLVLIQTKDTVRLIYLQTRKTQHAEGFTLHRRLFASSPTYMSYFVIQNEFTCYLIL